jgi:hypothetical protein
VTDDEEAEEEDDNSEDTLLLSLVDPAANKEALHNATGAGKTIRLWWADSVEVV